MMLIEYPIRYSTNFPIGMAALPSMDSARPTATKGSTYKLRMKVRIVPTVLRRERKSTNRSAMVSVVATLTYMMTANVIQFGTAR